MTHIEEVDEHLDYEKFYQTRNDTVSAGRATWEMWQGMADHYPCGTCKPFAQALTYGGEDIVRLMTDRRPKHPQQLMTLIRAVEEAKRKIGAEVECHGEVCHARRGAHAGH